MNPWDSGRSGDGVLFEADVGCSSRILALAELSGHGVAEEERTPSEHGHDREHNETHSGDVISLCERHVALRTKELAVHKEAQQRALNQRMQDVLSLSTVDELIGDINKTTELITRLVQQKQRLEQYMNSRMQGTTLHLNPKQQTALLAVISTAIEELRLFPSRHTLAQAALNSSHQLHETLDALKRAQRRSVVEEVQVLVDRAQRVLKAMNQNKK